jgi:hypothetical protein
LATWPPCTCTIFWCFGLHRPTAIKKGLKDYRQKKPHEQSFARWPPGAGIFNSENAATEFPVIKTRSKKKRPNHQKQKQKARVLPFVLAR